MVFVTQKLKVLVINGISSKTMTKWEIFFHVCFLIFTLFVSRFEELKQLILGNN